MSGAHRSAEAHGEATMNENGAFVARFCKSPPDLQNRPTFTKEAGGRQKTAKPDFVKVAVVFGD